MSPSGAPRRFDSAPSVAGLRRLLALAALVLAASALAACGGGVPANGVAVVGDTVITKADFNHWLTVAAKGQQAQLPKKQQKTNPVPKVGTPQYNQLRDQVMQFLVNAKWIEAEASARGVKLTPQQVQQKLDQTKKQFFPKKGAYEKFLKQSGQTEADVTTRVKSQLLGDKLREQVTKGTDKVTDQQLQDYYNKNRQQFSQPERRDLDAVLTKTKAKADQARAAIESGEGFKAVAKRFSSDPSLKTAGGKLPAVTKGQNDKAFDDAVFSATKGKLVGPVKTQFGYYVFRVTKISKASTTPFAKAKEQIRQLVVSQNQQKALNTFVTDFQKKWKAKTECAKGFVVDTCKNFQKPKTTATTAAGAPQGGGTPPTGGSTPGK